MLTRLSAPEILRRLDYFNKTNDWTVFKDVPDIQSVNVLYPFYARGFRTKEVAEATDPRLDKDYGRKHS